jgi:hypothetical protein
LLGDNELVAQLVVNDCGFPFGGRVSVALDAQSFDRGTGGVVKAMTVSPKSGGLPTCLFYAPRLWHVVYAGFSGSQMKNILA